jgi:hypothetical protein
VVVHDLDLVSITLHPPETDAPLVIDPDAPLAGTVTAEALEAIPRRNSEIFQGNRRIELPQLSQSDAPHVWTEPPNRSAPEELPGILVTEAPDHLPIITRRVMTGKSWIPARSRGTAVTP